MRHRSFAHNLAKPTRVALALGATALLAGTALAQGQVRLLETGSSLLYPLFNLWVPAFQKVDGNVQITTQSTGSGTGIAQAISGTAQIGASDAYLSDTQMKQNAGMLNIPLAISSQMVNYNVPGLNGGHLKLSGPVLAAIYAGQIRNWDDAAIKKMNPGVNLPNHEIIPVHRSDGSGDTFLFTQFLSDTSEAWSKSLGFGTTVNWPSVQGAIGAQGNAGMVNALKGTPFSVAYIGISYKKAVDEANMGEAALQNRSGNFVLSSERTVSAAAGSTVKSTPADARMSLIFASGAQAYPIINYEYGIVKAQQPNPEQAQALKKFLQWAVAPNGGNAPSFLNQVSFVPLPAGVRAISERQIAQIR